jgi:hypothetical protein
MLKDDVLGIRERDDVFEDCGSRKKRRMSKDDIFGKRLLRTPDEEKKRCVSRCVSFEYETKEKRERRDFSRIRDE